MDRALAFGEATDEESVMLKLKRDCLKIGRSMEQVMAMKRDAHRRRATVLSGGDSGAGAATAREAAGQNFDYYQLPGEERKGKVGLNRFKGRAAALQDLKSRTNTKEGQNLQR